MIALLLSTEWASPSFNNYSLAMISLDELPADMFELMMSTACAGTSRSAKTTPHTPAS